MIIHTPSREAMQEIADAVVTLRNQQTAIHAGLRSMRRHWQAAGSARERRGKPTADIAGGADGTVELWDSSGATGTEVDVTNPYSITLRTVEFVRLVNVTGWAKPIAFPDELAECTEAAPVDIGPITGS